MKKLFALAGNPNVGKSTLFNALTGMNQHTGNWPGKTVSCARGIFRSQGEAYTLVDLPGCYSLLAHSEEEEIARDFICFERPDAVIAVCDATCLQRNLILVLQIIETGIPVLLCINLLDEARKKKIDVHLEQLSLELEIPVIGICARSREGFDQIIPAITQIFSKKENRRNQVSYPQILDTAICQLTDALSPVLPSLLNPRWLSIRLLEGNEDFLNTLKNHTGFSLAENPSIQKNLYTIQEYLHRCGYNYDAIQDSIAESFVLRSREIAQKAVSFRDKRYNKTDRWLDRLFTSKKTGFPLMLLLLLFLFWLTISGANLPSSLLAKGLFWVQDQLTELAKMLSIPSWIYSPILFGIYRVLAWVVSVMLPPMAIFFPLFTLLEDSGYLPRIAFNLDKCFQKCHACGKQALTLCMGLGCNAVGVTGCRIIDSPRERMIAILTNNLTPCNGRFPTILTIISLFLISGTSGIFSNIAAALALCAVFLFSMGMTFFSSWLLSRTLLRGLPSSFTLELPPYRRPQILKVLFRSIVDRTLFVLGRAVIIAAPAGLLIWLFANLQIGDVTLLNRCVDFLDPFARLLGLDGVILMSFILGMPANEIVIPIMLMTYLAQGSILELGNLTLLKELLTDNGWTWITAVSTVLFSLIHWPCGTTCLTIHRETKSIPWTLAAILLPTLLGMSVCFLFTSSARFLTALL